MSTHVFTKTTIFWQNQWFNTIRFWPWPLYYSTLTNTITFWLWPWPLHYNLQCLDQHYHNLTMIFGLQYLDKHYYILTLTMNFILQYLDQHYHVLTLTFVLQYLHQHCPILTLTMTFALQYLDQHCPILTLTMIFVLQYLDWWFPCDMWHQEVHSDIFTVNIFINFVSDSCWHHITVHIGIILKSYRGSKY